MFAKTSHAAIDLDESRLPLTVISLAWPVVAEQTSLTFVGLASTIMVGHLGAAALAGVGLSTQAMWIPQVTFNGIAVGATAVIARRVGEGNGPAANAALHQSVLIAAVVGLIVAPLLWLMAEPIMMLLRAQPDVVELGAIYMRASAPSMVVMLVMAAANAAMRAAGDTRTPMMTMIAANVSNVVIGYLLIYGFLGLPAMGVLGAGIAASVAWAIGCACSMAFVIRGVGPLRYARRRALSVDLPTAANVLRVGFPTAAENLQFQIAYLLFSIIISTFGTVVFAAHTVALRVENVAFMPGFGLGMAATALVGQALGAGRPDIAERAGKLAQWYAMALMSVLGVLMVVFRSELIAVFVPDKEVIEIGSVAVLIYAFSLPFMGTSNCLAGSLRGAGDTRGVLVMMAVGVWLTRLPFAYALAYWAGFGAVGAWSAAVIDINTRGLLAWRRFAAGRWKNIRV